MSFFDFTVEELTVPTALMFTAKVPVTLKVIDFKEGTGDKQFLELICSVQDGEHAGKQHKLFMSKNQGNKKNLVAFLEMFAPIMDWVNKLVQPSVIIGKTFTALPEVPKKYKGKMYQNLIGFAIVNDTATQQVVNSDLPF